LDYRIKKDGTFVDPRRLKLPAAEPIPKPALPAFQTLAELYCKTLTALAPSSPPHQVVMAQASPPPLWQPPLQTSTMVQRSILPGR
jgi:hypothetical protein